MTVSLGNAPISGLSIGSTSVSGVYLGSVKLWSSIALSTSPTSSVSDTTARVSFRASAATTVAVKYSTASDLSGATTTTGVAVDSTTDFTGKVDLAGLPAGTTHYYTLIIDGVNQHSAPFPTFKTFPAAGSPAAFSFAFGSCTRHGIGDDTVFNAIPAGAAFVMHLGDTVYADTDSPVATTLPTYRQKHQNAMADSDGTSAGWKAIRRIKPAFTMWDDHDLTNDFSAGTGNSLYAPALEAFQEYHGRANPDSPTSGQLYYSFQVGNVGFFVPDERSFRSPNANTDNGSKTFLGATQLAALKSWLLSNNTAFPIKFICSETTASGYAANTGGDSWGGVYDSTQAPNGSNGFRTERNVLWDFIDANQITGVVFLAGDMHWAASFKTMYGATTARPRYEFLSSPFNSSNLPPVSLAADPINGPVFWKYGGMPANSNAGVVTVDTTASPATVSFQLYNASGSLGSSYLTSLTQTDIDTGLAHVPVAMTFTGTLPGGTVGVAWTGTLNFAGDYTAPIAISASTGTIPAWMGTPTIDYTAKTVTWSGTPTTAKTESFTPLATDAASQTATGPAQSVVIAAASTNYWNPAQTSADISTSGATATRGAAADNWRSVVGLVAASGPLCYFEVKVVKVANKTTVGVANGSANVSSYIGADNNSVGMHSGTATVFRGGGPAATGSAYTTGDVLMFVVDATHSLLAIGKNGTWVAGNPASIASSGITITATGTLYPAAALFSSTGSVALRLSASEFSYAIPSGFTSWSGT
jgi:phosphodiesterase/alkaline phosphatase D-like protein